MPEFCRVEREGHTLTLTIDRPQLRNALHPPASREMSEVLDAFAADPELWVAILSGAGDQAFCAGNDLKYLAAGGELAWPESGFGGITRRFDLTKPVIAAVNGVALGGGFEIALACDLIVASERASFGLPEVRVGQAALAGGLHRLPRQIPQKQAMGMILTGRSIGAEEALRLGLVNEVVPHAELPAAARRWAEALCECAPLSVRGSKQAVLEGLEKGSLRQAMEARYPAVRDMLHSQDFLEGPRAFAEKRRPRWQGR